MAGFARAPFFTSASRRLLRPLLPAGDHLVAVARVQREARISLDVLRPRAPVPARAPVLDVPDGAASADRADVLTILRHARGRGGGLRRGDDDRRFARRWRGAGRRRGRGRRRRRGDRRPRGRRRRRGGRRRARRGGDDGRIYARRLGRGRRAAGEEEESRRARHPRSRRRPDHDSRHGITVHGRDVRSPRWPLGRRDQHGAQKQPHPHPGTVDDDLRRQAEPRAEPGGVDA